MIASAHTSNLKLAQTNNKLTVQSQNFADDSCAIRSLDWDRSRFDIEFGLRNGTTYNSYIIKGEKLAIIDTSHAKFEELWFEELLKKVNPQEVDYLITSHTEPDHSGLIGNLLELNQNIELEFQYLEEFPETGYKVEELLLQIQQAEKNNWLLMLVDRFDLKNWSFSFPKTSSVLINKNFNFSTTLLNEAINEVVEVDSEIIKRTFTASFEPNLDIEDIELIFNKLSESTDILNFRILKASEEAIELEYESYLNLEDAAEFLASLGAVKNI